MQLDDKTRKTVKITHLISKMPFEKIRMFYGSFLTVFFLNHIENKETHIPYFGSIKLDQKTMQLEFKPDKSLPKIIKQYNNGEITDIEKFFLNQINANLTEIVEKE